MAAAKSWRRLMGENQLPKVIAGVRFKDGAEVKRWLGKFGQRDKWSFCLTAARMAAEQEKR
jgi:hypothetical protein